jgi:adenylylsulfate reductase subunit B
MPSYVIMEKCDGCKGQDKTACQYICPNDLMVLNQQTMKAYNRDPAMCWECYNCVKTCPQQAIAVRNNSLKRFRFPTRTTPEGSAVPDGGFKTSPEAEDLKSPLLFTEPESLRVPQLPTLKK